MPLKTALCRAKWIGPGRGFADPVTDRQGEILGIEAGFSTAATAAAEFSGEDIEEVYEALAIEQAERKRLGLKDPTGMAAPKRRRNLHPWGANNGQDSAT